MGAMTLDEYQSQAMQTLQPDAELAYTLTKLMIEAAEAAQPVIKQKYHGKPSHSDVVTEELGDALYYIATSAALAGKTLEEIAEENIAKLRARHGETYNPAFYRG